jgi:hypothetical protein
VPRDNSEGNRIAQSTVISKGRLFDGAQSEIPLDEDIERQQRDLVKMGEGMQRANEPQCRILWRRWCGMAYATINEHPRGSARAARPSSSRPTATPNSQVFRLNRHDRIDIRQVEHTNQTGCSFGDEPPGLRRD